jgi:hypothetical protein
VIMIVLQQKLGYRFLLTSSVAPAKQNPIKGVDDILRMTYRRCRNKARAGPPHELLVRFSKISEIGNIWRIREADFETHIARGCGLGVCRN